jgi:hypothetical protein
VTGLYVQLDASYAQDPKILDLEDERSELLFVRSLAYCKLNLTDGFVHHRKLAELAPAGDADTFAADLVSHGLWVVAERGWMVPSWLKRNLSAEQIEERKAADRERKRKAKDAPDGIQTESERNDNGQAPDSLLEGEVEGEGKEKPLVAEMATADSPAAAPEVRKVFEAWCASTGKSTTRTKLDPKRTKLIKAALKNYPLDDVLDAVRGWENSPFHRGENEHRRPYNDLDLILRDAKHIEEHRDYARQPDTTEPIYK